VGRASVLDPGGEQGQELLARDGVEAADQLAVGVTPGEGAPGQGEALDEGRGRNDDPAQLQVVDDGTYDRLAPLGPDRGCGAGRDRDAIVGLPDGAQVEMTNDLARGGAVTKTNNSVTDLALVRSGYSQQTSACRK